MYPYGQLFRPQMAPGMSGGFGYPPGMPPGVGAPGVPPPPGMSAPPGVPGMGPPGVPGMAQANLPTRPGMPGFVPPANLPNINFNAPIIRLGTSNTRSSSISVDSRGGGGGQGGKGNDSGKGSTPLGFVRGAAGEDSVSPPTQEESLKTIFVGGIPKDFNDEWMERVLKAVARLRRWIRATDEEGRPCKFGFAEYEDIVSLECAIEVLEDLEIPAVDERKEAVKLMTIPDEKAPEYIKKYYESIESDEAAKSLAFKTALSEVKSILSEYADPTKRTARSAEPSSSIDANAPAVDGTTPDGMNGIKTDDPTAPQPEIVTIPLSVDDELSDIPADMREMVAKEIAAFRERSNRRDMERLKREEEVERMERERMAAPRLSRLASPPISAPTGPSGGSNSIPIGPSRLREGAPASAPTAPSRMTGGLGSQIPRDYQKGVTFVNGTTAHGYWSKEEEELDVDDEELEKRRKEKKAREQETSFLDHERRWLNRERSRTSALERETQRDKEDELRQQKEKEAMAKRLAEWDDDIEASKKLEDYYVDRSLWIRNRTAFRQREIEMDERDKIAEQRQIEMEKRAVESATDRFLENTLEELDRARKEKEQPQQKFKLSLGAAAAAAKKAAADSAPTGRTRLRKTAAEVEGLLEDEEEDANKTKRVLIPIQYDASADQGVLDDEQREQLARQLAQEIPSDRRGLFEWNVAWEFVDEAMVKDKLQPFVEKKIVEYLGVQEQEVVGFVVGHIKKRGGAEDLVKELEMALDEDAEVMVKKVWRMLIFYSETEKRGLS